MNYEYDNWTSFLPIAEFAYNNTKNVSTGHTLFELNCGYHSKVFYQKNVDLNLKSKAENKLAAELKLVIFIYKKYLYYVQELQKPAHDKNVKPRSYTPKTKFS